TPAPAPVGPPVAGPVVLEDDAERRREIREAFTKGKALADDELAEQIKPLLQELGAAHAAADGERVVACFDVPRMYDELIRLRVLPAAGADRSARAEAVASMRLTMVLEVPRGPVLTHWTGTEVRKVRKRDAIDAVVIARHRQDDGKVLKVRWWVSRESG